MRKEHSRQMWAIRQVKPRRQLLAAVAREGDAFGCHARRGPFANTQPIWDMAQKNPREVTEMSRDGEIG